MFHLYRFTLIPLLCNSTENSTVKLIALNNGYNTNILYLLFSRKLYKLAKGKTHSIIQETPPNCRTITYKGIMNEKSKTFLNKSEINIALSMSNSLGICIY